MIWMVVEPYPSEKYEFVNGKDYIPYMKWKIKLMFQTHQPVVDLPTKKKMIYMDNHHFPMVFRVFPYVCTILHFEFSLVVPASCPKAPRPTSFLPNDLRVFVFLRRHGQIHGITWWPSGGKVAMWAPGNRININIYNYIYIYTFKIINHYTPNIYIYT